MKKCRGSAPLAGLRPEMPSDERAHCRFSERYGALARRVFPVHGRHMSHRGGIHARQPADAHGPGSGRHRRHGRADGHRRGRFRRTHQPASFTADQGHGQATHFAGLFAAADCFKSACGPGPRTITSSWPDAACWASAWEASGPWPRRSLCSWCPQRIFPAR